MRLIFKPDSEIHVVGWGVHQRRVCFVQGGDRGTGEVLLSQSVIFVVHTQRIFVHSLYGSQPSSIHLHCVCRCQYDLQIVLFVTSCNSTSRLSFSRACNLSCSCVIGKVHFAQYTICDALCALSAVYLCCVFCTLCILCILCCVQVGGRGIRRVMADRSCRS